MLPYWITDQMAGVVQLLFCVATIVSSVVSVLFCCRTG